jgi:hypothetical protein
VTGSRLVERCREIDPATTPSTVYRTLDVLEALGVISHSHGFDGHEEFHVRPVLDHGHLICSACGTEDELAARDAAEPRYSGRGSADRPPDGRRAMPCPPTAGLVSRQAATGRASPSRTAG